GFYLSPKVSVRYTKSFGHSVYSCGPLSASESLVSVPSHYLLNVVSVLSSIHTYKASCSGSSSCTGPELLLVHRCYLAVELGAMLTQLSSFQMVAMFLLLESKRGSASFFHPFLTFLAASFDACHSLPLTWLFNDSSDLILLLPHSMRAHQQKIYTRFTADYNAVLSFLTSLSVDYAVLVADKLEFLKFWLAINTRCLYNHNFTLCPLIDFLNHTADQDSSVQLLNTINFTKNDTHFDFSLRITSNSTNPTPAPNLQIYLNYGPHSNEFLINEYGFKLPYDQNSWNDLDLTHYLLNSLSLKPFQYKYLNN
ncbi:protein-lysine N-methyltransferase, partial [Ascoidea rubescens DSM 1968]